MTDEAGAPFIGIVPSTSGVDHQQQREDVSRSVTPSSDCFVESVSSSKGRRSHQSSANDLLGSAKEERNVLSGSVKRERSITFDVPEEEGGGLSGSAKEERNTFSGSPRRERPRITFDVPEDEEGFAVLGPGLNHSSSIGKMKAELLLPPKSEEDCSAKQAPEELSMQFKILIVLVFLLSGAGSTLLVKLQNKFYIDGVAFSHPYIQAFVILLGEQVSLPVYYIHRWLKVRRGDELVEMVDYAGPSIRWYHYFLFGLSGVVVQSLWMNALLLTDAGMYAMLKKASVLFTVGLSICWLKKRYHRFQWLGLGFVLIGFCLLFLRPVFEPSSSSSAGGGGNSTFQQQSSGGNESSSVAAVASSSDSGSNNATTSSRSGTGDEDGDDASTLLVEQLIGNVLVVLGSFVSSLYANGSEKVMRSSGVPALQLNGFNSITSVCSLAIIIGLMQPFEDKPEDVSLWAEQFSSDWRITVTTFGIMLCAFAFVVSSTMVTKAASATHRKVIASLRVLIVWVVALGIPIYEEEFAFTQLVAFVVLTFGVLVFGKVIKLPCAFFAPNVEIEKKKEDDRIFVLSDAYLDTERAQALLSVNDGLPLDQQLSHSSLEFIARMQLMASTSKSDFVDVPDTQQLLQAIGIQQDQLRRSISVLTCSDGDSSFRTAGGMSSSQAWASFQQSDLSPSHKSHHEDGDHPLRPAPPGQLRRRRDHGDDGGGGVDTHRADFVDSSSPEAEGSDEGHHPRGNATWVRGSQVVDLDSTLVDSTLVDSTLSTPPTSEGGEQHQPKVSANWVHRRESVIVDVESTLVDEEDVSSPTLQLHSAHSRHGAASEDSSWRESQSPPLHSRSGEGRHAAAVGGTAISGFASQLIPLQREGGGESGGGAAAGGGGLGRGGGSIRLERLGTVRMTMKSLKAAEEALRPGTAASYSSFPGSPSPASPNQSPPPQFSADANRSLLFSRSMFFGNLQEVQTDNDSYFD